MIWALIVCGSGLQFDAQPYAWMKTGNLLASLASLRQEYCNALVSLVSFHLYQLPIFAFAVSTLNDTSCIYLQPTLFSVDILPLRDEL